MALRNMFTFNRCCSKIYDTMNKLQIKPSIRSPVNHVKIKTNNFSTTPLKNECIKFANHDDFVKKVFVENELPVVVDFHAEWCEPSKQLTEELLEQLELRHDVGLAIVNVESHIDLVHTFDVKAVPAVLVIKNGLVVYKYIGLLDKKVIENILEQISRRGEASEWKNPVSRT